MADSTLIAKLRKALDVVLESHADVSPESIGHTEHTSPKATCAHPMCKLERALNALDEVLPRVP